MTRIALIRPGETDYDEQDRIQGTLDVPLSARGQQEVAEAADQLRQWPMAMIYCAPGEPCETTAKVVAKAVGCKIKKVSGLRNTNLGLWQGLRQDDIKRKHPRLYRQWHDWPERVCPPEGEALSDAYERIGKVVVGLLKRHREQEVIGIVVSEPLASLLRCYLQQRDLHEVWDTARDNGRWDFIDMPTPG